ncbi:MAG: hypothetical protein IT434_18310, partial [Phycisphaerales bacterium]|nr:hypothetical protein [Phycisphaerales bacterium]
KLNSTGQFLWATRAGGIDTDGAGQIRIDIFDNVYIAGWFTGKAEFGTLSTESADDKQRTYLAKITQDGHFNRLITAEGPTEWLITDMAIDRDGNSFLVGSMVLTINPPNVDTNAIALKLSPDGKNLWQKYAGGNGRDIGTAIGIDGKGAVYVGGSFQGDGRFGQTDLTSNGSDNIFIWKLKDIP